MTDEHTKEEIESGEVEADVLTEEGREDLVENDEMESWEAGFAQGASEEGQLAKDALTGEPIMDECVEREINGKLYRFVNEENAKKFAERQSKEA